MAIQNVSSVNSLNSVVEARRNDPAFSVAKVDRFLENMKEINPALARTFGQQVEDLRKVATDPQQILRALKLSAAQLTGQDQLDFQAAVQGVQDDFRARNHRLEQHETETGPPIDRTTEGGNNRNVVPAQVDLLA